MKYIFMAIAVVFIALACVSFAHAEDKVLFGFEKDTQGWAVPEWALEKEDCVAKVFL